MNLEFIMLGEISQSQKNKYCIIPLNEAPGKGEVIEKVDRWLPGARRRAEWRVII